MFARLAGLIGGGLLLTLIVPAAAAGQTRFELGAGIQYGVRTLSPPLTRGWIASGGFEIDQQDFVVEVSWHRRRVTRERRFFAPGGLDGFEVLDEVSREIYRGSMLTVAAGVRGGDPRGRRFSPFYQVLVGGMSLRLRTDYEWPASIDTDAENANCGGYFGDELVAPCLNVLYPEYELEHRAAFLMQPGVGLDVRVARAVKVRLVTDLLVVADRDYMTVVPRLSGRIVVGFGR